MCFKDHGNGLTLSTFCNMFDIQMSMTYQLSMLCCSFKKSIIINEEMNYTANGRDKKR